MVEVTLMLNTVGLKVAVLGYFLLGDRLSPVEIGCLVIAFSGVVTLILGSEARVEESVAQSSNILAYILCLFACLMIALHAIVFRVMKEVNKWVIAFYMGLLGTIVFFAGILAEPEGVDWFTTFSGYPA